VLQLVLLVLFQFMYFDLACIRYSLGMEDMCPGYIHAREKGMTGKNFKSDAAAQSARPLSAAQCFVLFHLHDVKPGVSWGSLSGALQKRWKANSCDSKVQGGSPANAAEVVKCVTLQKNIAPS
jgi:hypothetical protein